MFFWHLPEGKPQNTNYYPSKDTFLKIINTGTFLYGVVEKNPLFN